MSGDEDDSRTASVGVPRTQPNGSNAASRNSSADGKLKKRGQRNGAMAKTKVNDIVPRGGNFSNAPLEVDGESDSDSTSSSDESASASPPSAKEQIEARKPQAGAAPAVNWNKATRSSIRTSLGPKAKQSAFEAVNNKYFRSRSASTTSDEEQSSTGEVEKDHKNSDNKPYYMDDSENSDTDVSEGGDSILLNIGPQNGGASEKREETAEEILPFSFDSQPDPDSVAAAEVEEEDSESSSEASESSSKIPEAKTFSTSKEAAFSAFSALYPTPPTTLADLRREDLEIQARFFYSGQEIGELDLSKNIACTECLQDGHLSMACPTREVRPCRATILNQGLTHRISASIVEHGMSMKANSVHRTADVRNVGSAATTQASAKQPSRAVQQRCRATFAARGHIWRMSAISCGSSRHRRYPTTGR